MNGNLDKLEALGDALNVRDDTRELERPEPVRSVREVLEAEPGAGVRVPPVATAEAQSSRFESRRIGRPGGQTGERIRSTVNLPVLLSECVKQARRARWELSDLLAHALNRPRPMIERADELLARLRRDTWIQRHYRITQSDRQLLDDLAGDWRMNRSEAIAVLLAIELELLHLDQSMSG